LVKAYEYNSDGSVKRVEFFAPNDYMPSFKQGEVIGPRYTTRDRRNIQIT